ncbi:hypothetical protein [Acholeplasma granularum]|uniref:hypothetical protein n=1 Tax=Acholeplasma granularum TaxID=264635 RepID=UPI0004707FFC|nr:hypothetical protein [Acholeplasma granularum]
MRKTYPFMEIDLSEHISIQRANHSVVINHYQTLIDKKSNILKTQHEQGLLRFDSLIELNYLVDIMYLSIKDLIEALEVFTDLEEIIDDVLRRIKENKQASDKILLYMSDILTRLYNQTAFSIVINNQPVILKLKGFHTKDLFDLPKEVKYLIVEEKLDGLGVDILDSLSIKYLVTNNEFIIGNQYSLEQLDLNSKYYSLDIQKNKIERNTFKLGAKINNLADIENYQNLNIDYIIVQTEKSYILTDGLLDTNNRKEFYTKLYKTYPNTKIIITLPKLKLLELYFSLNESSYLTPTSILNHSTIYEQELEHAFSIQNENIIISCPNLLNNSDFKYIKLRIQHLYKEKYGKLIDVGMNVDNLEVFQHLEDFNKFDLIMLDTYQTADALKIDDILDKEHLKELTYLNYVVKRKKRDTYLIGEDINDPKVFNALVIKGFKRFTVDHRLINYYDKIIDQYNKKRNK